MRINYKTHVPLKWAHSGKMDDIINIAVEDRDFFAGNLWALDVVENAFNYHKKAFSEKAYVIKEPFYDAVVSAEERLFGVYSDSVKQGVAIDIATVYIYRDLVIFFANKPVDNGLNSITTMLVFDKDGSPVLFFIHDKEICDSGTMYWVSGVWLPYSVENRDAECKATIFPLMRTLVDFEIFKKFADVETVVVESKVKKVIDREKVLNETGIPVIFLDSRWFRNIIRNDGFGVRGHFRLQPKKINGEWTRELIWINDFEKHGYHSKARILSNAITA